MQPEGAVEPDLSALLRAIEQARVRYRGPGDVLLTVSSATTHSRTLLEDSKLPPASKVLWLLLAHSCEGAAVRRFPAIPDLGRLANIRSAATLAAALDALRINRWLTISETAKKTEPQVHVLHAPPLDPGLVLGIDPMYRVYLERSRHHAHKRLRALAKEALRAVTVSEAVTDSSDSVSGTRVQTHRAARWDFARKVRPKCFDSQKPAPVSTTACTETPELLSRSDESPGDLILPDRWTPEQVALAQRHLHSVAPSLRQAVIDEVEGRVAAVARGARPLYDELRFMKKLCVSAEAGAFEPNLGGPIRVRRERAARRQDTRPPHAVASIKVAQHSEAAAAKAFAEIRSFLSAGKSG